MPRPMPQHDTSVSLALMLRRLSLQARDWLSVEAELTRMELHATVKRALLACMAGAVALLLGMVTLFVAAQTAVVALAVHAGGPVPAGLIVTLTLLLLTAAAATFSRTLIVRRSPAESVVFRWIGGHRMRE